MPICARFTALAAVFGLAACGTVPTHGVDGPSDLKNYDRTLYERLSTESRSLYERLGGMPVIERIVDEGIDRSVANPAIGHLFADSDLVQLKERLSEQICQLAGGPCVYSGLDMESAHRGLGITAAQFNHLVEDFQAAMRNQGVPFGLENQVLALLAPMKPAVVGQ